MATTTNYGWTTPNDTDLVRDGASAIRSLGSAIDTTVFNNANAAVGAGKNKVINGDFNIWQRGTTFTGIANDTYSADRWTISKDKTTNITRETFTAGTAPVAGYEGTYYLRQVISGGSYYALQQRVEDVRQFAGQTVPLSFWAKADAAVSNTIGINQYFGSGGSATVSNYAAAANITTSWARYSYTVTLGSMSGKTIGANSYLIVQPILIQNGTTHTIDIWGVQLEAGNTATAFQTATGTLAGELAACQRYYARNETTSGFTALSGWGMATTTTTVAVNWELSVPMRIEPVVLEYGNLRATDTVGVASNISTLVLDGTTPTTINLSASGLSGFTQYRPAIIQNRSSGTGYIAVSAEL